MSAIARLRALCAQEHHDSAAWDEVQRCLERELEAAKQEAAMRLHDTIELAAQIEELRRDKARLDWLERHIDVITFDVIMHDGGIAGYTIDKYGDSGVLCMWSATLFRDAIDAAMTPEKAYKAGSSKRTTCCCPKNCLDPNADMGSNI